MKTLGGRGLRVLDSSSDPNQLGHEGSSNAIRSVLTPRHFPRASSPHGVPFLLILPHEEPPLPIRSSSKTLSSRREGAGRQSNHAGVSLAIPEPWQSCLSPGVFERTPMSFLVLQTWLLGKCHLPCDDSVGQEVRRALHAICVCVRTYVNGHVCVLMHMCMHMWSQCGSWHILAMESRGQAECRGGRRSPEVHESNHPLR